MIVTGKQKYLEDDCTDRVEEEILALLGDANDMSIETILKRHKYYNDPKAMPVLLHSVHQSILRADEAVQDLYK